MDRNLKITELKELKKAIKQKEAQIEQEKIELKLLEEQYDKQNVSQLPILLFGINQTLPMPEEARDFKYQYIYYCPDLDDIKCIEKNSENDFLQNTIDLRECFENFGVPKNYWVGECYYEFHDEIMQAVSILKSSIDEIFSLREINSWHDLGNDLNNFKNCKIKK